MTIPLIKILGYIRVQGTKWGHFKNPHLKERKMILGWLWDFRSLTIQLPANKFTAWSTEISKMITTEKTSPAELKSMIKRLAHVSMILSPVHHFLS